MNTLIINAQNVCLEQQNSTANAAIDIALHAGFTYGFIGPDCTLISSWLQILAGITPPAAGNVQFLGQNTLNLDRNKWQKLRIDIAYLNHQSTLLSVLSTQENILLPALYHQLDLRETLLKNMLPLLDNIGFLNPDDLKKLPAYIDELTYSQAMLVRLVLTRPRLVILDNNLRHFDERNTRQLLRFVQSSLNMVQTSLIIQDDDIDFVLKHATKIVFVDHNCLLQFDSPDEFRASGNQYVLHYLNEMASA